MYVVALKYMDYSGPLLCVPIMSLCYTQRRATIYMSHLYGGPIYMTAYTTHVCSCDVQPIPYIYIQTFSYMIYGYMRKKIWIHMNATIQNVQRRMYSQSHIFIYKHFHTWYMRKKTWIHMNAAIQNIQRRMYSQSHLGWHFRMLFQSSRLKTRTSLFTEMWQKRRSSFELWAFENVTASEIGCV